MSASDFLERIVNAQWAFKKGDVATPRRLPESRQIRLTNRFHVAVQSLVIIYYLICSFTFLCFIVLSFSIIVGILTVFIFVSDRKHDWGFTAV